MPRDTRYKIVSLNKMAKGSTFPYISILLTTLVVLIVFHIVTTKNPISAILKKIEGFQAPVLTTPKCPTGYKFFNDKIGESFCCNGSINAYTHTCTAKGGSDLCAFKPNVQDPRNPSKILPLCNSLIAQQSAAAQSNFCPQSLPNYASIGKCCMSSTDLDGYDCSDYDNARPKQYCIVTGAVKPNEQSCSALRQDEQTMCPSSLAKVTYTLGQREAEKYGSNVKGVKIPVCFTPESSCIADNVLSYAQQQGAWTDKNSATWKYACANWEKVNIRRDLTGVSDLSYT
jgi:hypothetical protein